MNSDFWQGKKVFITGHTGFKGAWLSLWLKKLGANVVGYALEPPTRPNLFQLANIESGMSSIIGDIADYDSLLSSMCDAEPDIIFHMAAQPLVRYSYRNPIETYRTNVLGVVHVLEASRQVKSARAIVNITTDKCYENRNWDWGYRENDRLGGHDPYSNSKACSELVTSAYRDSYFLDTKLCLASARAGNVIGGGDWAEDRLIPDIVRSVSSSKTLQIRYPDATRPWQHVLEPLAGYMLLARHLYTNGHGYDEAWNFGPSDLGVATVGDVAKCLEQLWKGALKWEVLESEQIAHEAKLLRLDCSKARNVLGWKPVWTLEETLTHTVEWYQAWSRNLCMKDFCLKQIDMYEAALNG